MEMGSSSSTDASGASDSLINGLKFGRKIYFEDVGVGGSSSSSSSSKALAPPPEPATLPARRGKGVMHGGGQPPRCQVEGCKVDLTGAKAYYCRHKVCGMHSKTPKVIVAGLEQRFCQQCSRFHQLPEFDQGKRSCRRRLAGHNERRRKPPPGSLSISHYERPSSSFHDDSSRYRSFLMDFTYPRPPTAARDVTGTVRAHNRLGNQCPGSLSIPHGAHSYLQVPDSSLEFPPGQCLVGVSDSSCALSLLSTQPWGTTSCRNRAASFSANSGFYDDPIAQPVTNSCLANPWGFVVNRSSSSSHEMGRAHPGDSDNCQFSGELELALQGSRQYPNHGHSGKCDHSGHPMHWPH